MEMTLRWYGPGYDSVTLKQIRQIPGVKNVITTLFGKQAGELWLPKEIAELKKIVNDAGLGIAGIESVNVSDDIKIGTAKRDEHIDNYIKTLQALGEADIHMVCYNFMPVFDWTRTELARVRPDGSTVLAYNQDTVDMIDPEHMRESVEKMSNGFVMPGWEPERLDRLKELFEMYKDVDDEKLFENLKYFLERIMPVCNKYDIKMAIHPDDPAWSVFGLPRIITCEKNLDRFLKIVDSPANGLTFCTGSLGANPENHLPYLAGKYAQRIHFLHLRNILITGERQFCEVGHPTECGSLDMYGIVRSLCEAGFDGYVRPDHGRMIWGESGRYGYGLYDRAWCRLHCGIV